MGFASGKLGGSYTPTAVPGVAPGMTPGENPYDVRRPMSEGLGGYGVNIVRDLRDFVSGLATMSGSIIGDVGKGVAEGLTLGEFESGGYSDFSKGVLHDVVKAAAEAGTFGTIETGGGALDIGKLGEGYALAPAIGADYASRYGSGAGFLRGLYEHPLAFVSDVATVATAGSYGAARAGTALSRIPKIASETALLAENPAAQVSRAARFVSKVQGKATPVLTAEGTIDLIPPAYSPIRRLYQRGLGKALTRPIEQFDQEIVAMRNLLEESSAAERPQIQAQLTQLERVREIAREGGIERVLRPRVEQFQLRRIADGLIGTTGSRFIHERETLTREFGEILAQIPEELTPEAAVHALQLLDTSMLIDDPALMARVARAEATTARRAARTGTASPRLIEALQVASRDLDEINETVGQVAPVGERLIDLGAERAWLQSEIDRVANRRVAQIAQQRRVGPLVRFDPSSRRIGNARNYRQMLETRLSETERDFGRLTEIHGIQEARGQMDQVGQRLANDVVTPSEYRAALRQIAEMSPEDYAAATRLAFGDNPPPQSLDALMFRARHAATDTAYLDNLPEEGAFVVRDPIGRDLGRVQVNVGGDLPPGVRRMRYHSDCIWCRQGLPHREHHLGVAEEGLDEADLADTTFDPEAQDPENMIRTAEDLREGETLEELAERNAALEAGTVTGRITAEGLGPGVLGPRGVKQILRELHLRYPEVREWQINKLGRQVRFRVPPDRLRAPEVRRLNAPDVGIELSEHADYVAARANTASEYQPFLTLYSPRELAERNARTYLTDDHTAGYFVDPDGQVGGVFATPDAQPGVGKAMMVHAIQNGGTYLFHFDGFLTDYYARFGFRPFASLPWDQSQAPTNWNYERYGTPRVVWMRYEGGPRESIADRYATFRDVEPLASIRRAGSSQGALGAEVAARPRPGMVEGEQGAARPGVVDDLAARPVADSFVDLPSADQQAAIVDAGYPEAMLGENVMDVVREDLRLWDEGVYIAPEAIDRVENLVNQIWERHPLANQPLPDTLFDPDDFVGTPRAAPIDIAEEAEGIPGQQRLVPGALTEEISPDLQDMAERQFWRDPGASSASIRQANQVRETWTPAGEQRYAEWQERVQRLGEANAGSSGRNQWGLEIPERHEWNFEVDYADPGGDSRWRVFDDDGRYEGYATVGYNNGIVNIGEMGVGFAGEGTNLSDVRMNGLVDQGLQDWFYNDLQAMYPGVYAIEFSTVNSAASINRGWSQFLDQWIRTGQPMMGYNQIPRLPTLTAFTPEQLQRTSFGRIVQQMSLEERQEFAMAMRYAHSSGRHVFRQIPAHRLTEEGARNKAAAASGQTLAQGGTVAPQPLENVSGGVHQQFGVMLSDGHALVVVPDPTGAAHDALLDQRTFAALRDDIPAIQDGVLGRGLYPANLRDRMLPEGFQETPLTFLNMEQRERLGEYLLEEVEAQEERYFQQYDEWENTQNGYEPDTPFGGQIEELREVIRAMMRGETEAPDELQQYIGYYEGEDLLSHLERIEGMSYVAPQLSRMLATMDPTDLLVELRGSASRFDDPTPEGIQAARDAGAEMGLANNLYRPGIDAQRRHAAIYSPHAVARVNRQWTRQTVEEAGFGERVGSAGYSQFGEDAVNRAAVEITRAATGEVTPEELARVQALLPEDAWRILNERLPEPSGGQNEFDMMDRYRLGAQLQQERAPDWLVVDPESDGISSADHTTLRRAQAFNDDEVHIELPGLDVPGNPIAEYQYVAGEVPYWDQVVTGAADYNAETARAIAEQMRAQLMPQWVQMFGPEGVQWRTKGLAEIESAAQRLGAGVPMTGWAGVRDIAGARIIHPEALSDPMKVLQEAVMGLDPGPLGGTPRIWDAVESIRTAERDGTRAYTVTLQMPNGAPIELQLMTPMMHKAEEATWRTRVWMSEKLREIALRQNDYEAIPIEEWEQVEKAGRYMQGMWEAVTDEIREDFLGVRLPQMRRVMNDLRLQVGRTLADPMIAEGFSPDLAFDAQYLPLRLSRGARWDKDTGDFAGGPTTLALDNEIAGEGLPSPIYYPKYDARTPRKFTDWLLPRRTQGMRARTSKPGYEQRNTGYLTAEDLYVKDPYEAYSRRASLAIRKREALHLVEAITRRFGHRIHDGDIISPNEVVFAPDFLRRFYKMRVKVDDEVMRRVQQRLAANGYTPEQFSMDEGMWDLVRQTIVENQDDMVGLTSRGVELWAIPKIVGDRLDASMKPMLGHGARLFWDTPTNLWRGMALAGSPRWIVNNLFGNVLFLKMQGGKLTDVIRQFSPRFRKAVRGTIGEEGLSQVEGGLFGTVGAYQTKLGAAANTPIGQVYSSIGKSPVGRGFKKFGDFMRGLNSEVENAFRRASYITAAERTAMKAGLKKTGRSFWTSKTSLDRIYGVGADERLLGKAVNEVNYFFNDYNAMSPFGRQVMRRFLVPFWGFYRHVTRLLLTFPFEHPVRFGVMRQLTQMGNEIEQDYSGGLPDWARGFVPIGPGALPFETRFMSTRGPDPFSAVFQAPISLVHPLIKSFYEWNTGRSTLSGREFTDPSVGSAFGSDEQFRVSPKEGGGFNVERVETVRPSVWEMLAQQIPQYDLLKDSIAGGRTYDTSTLFDAIFDRAGAVRVDPNTGEPYTPFSGVDALSRMFGLTTYDINLTAEQAQAMEEQRAAILSVLRQSGYVPPDETVAAAAAAGGGGGYAAMKLRS